MRGFAEHEADPRVENQRLKKLVAEQALDIDMLKELAERKLLTPERRRRAVGRLQQRALFPYITQAITAHTRGDPVPLLA
jgi:endonuclease/exonuclease/phosphatase family metal-dependent hydrolase